MSVEVHLQNYKILHTSAMWRLLNADTTPEILACLQALLFDKDRVLKASIATTRLESFLNKSGMLCLKHS